MGVIESVEFKYKGQIYRLDGWDGNDPSTIVSDYVDSQWAVVYNWEANIPGPGQANPPNSGWKRNAVDQFYVVDVDGDGNQGIFVVNPQDGWCGLWRWYWQGQFGLTYVWGSSPALQGPGAATPPGTGWRIGQADHLLGGVALTSSKASDIVVYNNNDLWTGIFEWTGNSYTYAWGSKGSMQGPAGNWNRTKNDQITIGQFDGAPSVNISNASHQAILGWDAKLGMGPIDIIS